MIESFQHKGLKRFYERGERRGLNPNMIPKIEEILSILSAAESVEEANIPGYRLHPLTGELKGFWSVRVTGNWRIVFRFEDGNALDIDLVDYH
ncbi:MAG: type II toxin-antitoxin system RelE/ParE family toxin [Microcystis sp.]|jgi:proteic killer suppression protein|uniref:Type II toxin-antitoxin system mRNA interferase toxin, RelE/StbE family n=1 Tax=Microcystis aeruginosa G11-04 TaxID=2685956 RepID=A0A966L6H5_MICAE|nr:type II toxin-antitoxin system mRNA interferase toxin, RelE/StbE family [Microcystis aeruginosa W13-16]NCQ73356.1 type II toxin-antitoxin system mRNA interferase toxin, RelE/StbE family [Microcystis aeruginosa W13-13]NCQ77847.1 type II toxin-antitoxin system mRNA interferase toxin, RelE/StbE family [Microcystis aeruginosa W13-15]NCR14504.1 type II toxin-antitoxin system mRNA interferase toxin, RelE/StbE family [Microcystis aeruginosa SX13-11]NCR21909.1 type II toxin-antitoxin system mRNA int